MIVRMRKWAGITRASALWAAKCYDWGVSGKGAWVGLGLVYTRRRLGEGLRWGFLMPSMAKHGVLHRGNALFL
jgi:hypothetical protein